MPPENLGARMVEEVTVDVTSLDSAGTEPLSTWDDASGLDSPDNYVVIDQEDPSLLLLVDRSNGDLLDKRRGPEMNQKSEDPGSQTYSSNEETVLATYDAGAAGTIVPLNFNPADPSDADLNVVLRAEFHDGTTTDLATVADGSEQSFENLVDGFATGDDGKRVRKLIVLVDETGGADATEDIGATTTEFWAVNVDVPNNADIGEVELRLEGRS